MSHTVASWSCTRWRPARYRRRVDNSRLGGEKIPRQPPHFKLRVSIANHAKTVGVWIDNDLLAMYVRLGVLAIERYADKTADSFLLTEHDAMRVTCRRRSDHAWNALERLANQSPIAVERTWNEAGTEARTAHVTFPNFAKKQGFGPRNGAATVHSASASASATATATKKESATRSAKRTPTDPMQRGLNALSKRPGTEEEKRVFLAAELDLVEAEADAERAQTKRNRFRPILIRFYNQWRKRQIQPDLGGTNDGPTKTEQLAERVLRRRAARRALQPGGGDERDGGQP